MVVTVHSVCVVPAVARSEKFQQAMLPRVEVKTLITTKHTRLRCNTTREYR